MRVFIRLLYIHPFQKLAFRYFFRYIQGDLNRIKKQRRLLYIAILKTIDRLLEQHAITTQISCKVAVLWARALITPSGKIPAARNFRDRNGVDPPRFITISPGYSCNLKCKGCYATSSSTGSKLDWYTLEHIVNEAKESWDIRLIVFSGGEPLLYTSDGKGVLDIVERNPDLLFLMFTNGTLIDEQTAKRLSRLGNLTPAFSVEGLQHLTDTRRGQGIFSTVKEKMKLVRQVGLPFGVSVTVTRYNCEEVLSDRFLELFFHELGAFYMFFFQYLPIGRDPNFELMPTPEQRISFLHKVWGVIEEKQLFLIDFWNHGPLVNGCISAGRARGYLYIDWNGNIMPCVFTPYAAANIHRIYQNGGTLNDVLSSPFFKAIRDWQVDYGFGSAIPTQEGNLLSPCPFRDHYHKFRQWIEQYHPEPEDKSAREALLDTYYYNRMVEYGTRFSELSQAEWNEKYLSS